MDFIKQAPAYVIDTAFDLSAISEAGTRSGVLRGQCPRTQFGSQVVKGDYVDFVAWTQKFAIEVLDKYGVRAAHVGRIERRNHAES